MRDKFIAGIRSKETKKVLLTLSGKKKFAEVVEDAKREELVRQASGKMQFGESSGVNRVAFSNQNQNWRKRGRNQSVLIKCLSEHSAGYNRGETKKSFKYDKN